MNSDTNYIVAVRISTTFYRKQDVYGAGIVSGVVSGVFNRALAAAHIDNVLVDNLADLSAFVGVVSAPDWRPVVLALKSALETNGMEIVRRFAQVGYYCPAEHIFRPTYTGESFPDLLPPFTMDSISVALTQREQNNRLMIEHLMNLQAACDRMTGNSPDSGIAED